MQYEYVNCLENLFTLLDGIYNDIMNTGSSKLIFGANTCAHHFSTDPGDLRSEDRLTS